MSEELLQSPLISQSTLQPNFPQQHGILSLPKIHKCRSDANKNDLLIGFYLDDLIYTRELNLDSSRRNFRRSYFKLGKQIELN